MRTVQSEKQTGIVESIQRHIHVYGGSWFVLFLVLQVGVFFVLVSFKWSFLPLVIVGWGGTWFWGLVSKGTFSPIGQTWVSRLLLVSLLLFIFSLVSHWFVSLYDWAVVHSPERADTIFRAGFLVDVLVFLISVSLFRSTYVQTYWQRLKETNHVSEWFASVRRTAGNDYDVIVCYEEETKKPIRIPFFDRFLHMLILGPTGSGKTSQILIPMIHQDISKEGIGVTVLDPKGDLAITVCAMAKKYNRKYVYFNPVDPECPYFNPLYGKESDVLENITTTFKMLGGAESSAYFQDQNEILLKNAIKVLKRMYGNRATLIMLYRFVTNVNNEGQTIVREFSKLSTSDSDMLRENKDIAAYFMNDYFAPKSKTHEHTTGIRNQLAKITSNEYLRRVLNPPNGENDVNFDLYLENADVIAITTAQGQLRQLSSHLGFFLILQFQSAVFRRPGTEDTRVPNALYIDEFQTYANPGFAEMLTQGRSYRVASHLATQNRALIGAGQGAAGKDFIEAVSTNARNVVLFPGANANDATYYSTQSGEVEEIEEQRGESRSKFSLFHKPKVPTESINYSPVRRARLSVDDIIYMKTKEIVIFRVENMNVQPPQKAKVEYIPKDLNQELKEIAKPMIERLPKPDTGAHEVGMVGSLQHKSGSHYEKGIVVDEIVAPIMAASPLIVREVEDGGTRESDDFLVMPSSVSVTDESIEDTQIIVQELMEDDSIDF